MISKRGSISSQQLGGYLIVDAPVQEAFRDIENIKSAGVPIPHSAVTFRPVVAVTIDTNAVFEMSVGVTSCLGFQLGKRFALGLRHIEDCRWFESNQPLGSLLGRRLVVVTVAVLVVAWRVLALWTLLCDDRRADPDG